MKHVLSKRFFAGSAIVATIAALAACAPKPAPPPPPAPVVVVIPPRPNPPLGAPAGLTVPPLAPDGTRITVNRGVSAAQALWNLRSAYNVAALNCLDPQYAPILAGYSHFLKTHAKTLTAVNKELDKTFKQNYGAKSYIRERETYQTQVYNYFALPPVMPAFCNAALAMSNEVQAIPAGQLEGYTMLGLSRVDTPFREFFNSFDQYRADLAAWEARYGAQPVGVAPAVLGVQGLSQ
ncbi:hypothetical protein [Novosphingobium album (ex Liu et al. 2023)]|uniref:Uncharacterized protein n=1 Tax=Novosphingobium album (ex Liu et al. 2023) TaxID=3031130 RepID=A0ABT5WK33_9SPHN|nr:hypothetical protein [Novosphingobium album (ex Liu et al. 2023)]MDE8650408.1 hypothetical protein [Novosphingobium album (ex Liu et al. 2023)]